MARINITNLFRPHFVSLAYQLFVYKSKRVIGSGLHSAIYVLCDCRSVRLSASFFRSACSEKNSTSSSYVNPVVITLLSSSTTLVRPSLGSVIVTHYILLLCFVTYIYYTSDLGEFFSSTPDALHILHNGRCEMFAWRSYFSMDYINAAPVTASRPNNNNNNNNLINFVLTTSNQQ